MVYSKISQLKANFFNYSNIFTLVFFLFLVFTKLLYLDGDTVAITNLHNEDEGNYVYNVRNYIVEGTFFKDDTNFILLSPLYSFLVYFPVKILGISIFSFRLTSAIFGTLTIVLGYLGLKHVSSNSLGLIFAILLGSDFLFNIHSRIAMPEVTASFFFLVTCFLYIHAKNNKNITLYFLTGITAGLGFLIKSNAAIIVSVCIGFEILNYFINSFTAEKLPNLKEITNLIIRNLSILLGFGIPILYWGINIIKPNLNHFELVNIGLIQLHKPQLRGQLMDPVFLWNELKEFGIGGEGNVWIYLSPYFLAIVIGTIYAIRKKTLIKDNIFWFSVLWFFLGNLFFYILWYKPARWYIPNIIPLIIIATFFINWLPKKTKTFIFTLILGTNLLLSYNYIFLNPTFYLKSASKRVENIVRKNTYAGDSLILMENKQSLTYNPYFNQPVYTTETLPEFLNKHQLPTFVVLIKGQFQEEIIKTNKYVELETNIQSSNLESKRFITVYKRK